MSRKNLCTNPSLETNLTGYTKVFTRSGITAGTIGRTNTIAAQSGTYYGFINVTGSATDSQGSSDLDIQFPAFPVTPGAVYLILTHLRHTGAGAVALIHVIWKNSVGTVISTGTGGYTALSTTAWDRKENQLTAPANAATATIQIWIDGLTETVQRSFRWDATLYELNAAIGATYFDGDSAGASWDGTAHASTSTLVTSVTVAPESITSQESWGQPAVVAQPVTLAPLSIASQEAWGAPAISPGSVTRAVVSIETQESWGLPFLGDAGLRLEPLSISSQEAWGQPALFLGPVSLSILSIVSKEEWGQFAVTLVGKTPPAFALMEFNANITVTTERVGAMVEVVTYHAEVNQDQLGATVEVEEYNARITAPRIP